MATPQTAPTTAPEKGVLLKAQPEAESNDKDPQDMLRKAPKVKIKIHRTHAGPETDDVYVGVNGIGFQIQRGVDVEVPEPVMKVLEDAVQTVYHKAVLLGKGVLVPNQVPAYPFTRLN